jgi:DNA-binding NarL/FixJ family response regulator
MEPITILLADDHRLLRESWKHVLETDRRFIVIAEACNNAEIFNLIPEKRPRILLMDLHMPPFDGIMVTRQICLLYPGTKVIGVAIHNLPAYARKILAAGALGYITKNSGREEMIKAILAVSLGQKYVCSEMFDALSTIRRLPAEQIVNNMTLLTDREKEVIELVMLGLSSGKIGQELSITERTVEVHRYNVLRKLQLHNTASLVNHVSMYGL